MPIVIDLKPDHEINVDADFLAGTNNLEWGITGGSDKAVALQADGGAAVTLKQTGSEGENDGWFLQCALDDVATPGTSYVIVLKARETGIGATWGGVTPSGVVVNLVYDNGQTNAKLVKFPNISGTYQSYFATFSSFDTDDTLTPNSVLLKYYAEGFERKELQIDFVGFSALTS